MNRSANGPGLSFLAAVRATIRTDRCASLAVGLVVGWALIYATPWGLGSGLTRRFAELSFLVLAVFALSKDRQRLRDREERRFWRDLQVALCCWLAVAVVYLFFPVRAKPVPVEILAEILYVLYYAFFLLAVERRPDRRSRWRPVNVERALTWPAVLVFILGIYVYFSVIPRAHRAPDSPIYIYVFLDIYLLAKLLYLQHSAGSVRWKLLYRLLVVTSAFMLFSDSIELGQDLGKIPANFGDWPDLLLGLPLVVLVLAARARHLRGATSGSERDFPRLSGPSGKTMVSALAFPLIHFTCSSLGLLDAGSKSDREFVVAWWLLLLGTLALIQHRRLEDEAAALWAERKLAARSLDRSEHELRLMMARESAEDALQAAEARFARAFSRSPEAIEIISLQSGQYVEVNPAFEKMSGYPRAQLIDRDVELWSDSEERRQLLEAIREGEPVRNAELKFRNHAGEERRRRVAAEIIEFDDEECLLLISEEVSGEVSSLFRVQAGLLASSRAAIFAMDTEDRMTLWNTAAEQLYGWTSEDVVGRSWSQIMGDISYAEMRHTAERRGFWQGGLRLRHRSGQSLDVVSCATLIRNGAGQPEKLLVLTHGRAPVTDDVEATS